MGGDKSFKSFLYRKRELAKYVKPFSMNKIHDEVAKKVNLKK